jgi:2-polyprenyl-3-methyl-5-hydroxy-6-metoxy-1,4-benzoquinol methylase
VTCRHCGAEVTLPFADLGSAPPSNAYLTETALKAPEKWYPLKVSICTECWLAQTQDYAHCSELFSQDYGYFSSFSSTWLQHAERYAAMACERFALNAGSHVVEVASNDGYLLQYFAARKIPCLGVEPTASTARAAREKGIEVVEEFFGRLSARRLAKHGKSADLIVANNVLAHVPDINDFVTGIADLLKPNGTATLEFPHLLKLVLHNQFDTIYHEHFSYLSLTTVLNILARSGLSVFDVEELPTHGGSLRVYAQKRDTGSRPVDARVSQLIADERAAEMTTTSFYSGFQAKADGVKNEFLSFLVAAKRTGKVVAAYGAAAKGNTLLNYAGVRPDLIRFVADRNPAKQNKYMPGSRIPIVPEGCLKAVQPDYIVILPWNLANEIVPQLSYARDWRCQYVLAVPSLVVSAFA